MKKHHRNILLGLSFFLAIVAYLFISLPQATSWGIGSNYRNVSVRTTVNITDSYPEILNLTCNGGSAITLTAASTKTVSCNITIRDYNGGDTINNTNMTFYYNTNQSDSPDNNNSHYTNATCASVAVNGYNATWACNVDLWYYAVNGSWRANFTVKDSYNMTANNYTDVTISALYALNVTDVIDYGNMAVGDTSGAIQANVTNMGNMRINVSVYAYGGDNETTGANWAMICAVRNITLQHERYGLSDATAYDSLTPITGAPTVVTELSIQKQELSDVYSLNSTYWRLHVNISENPFGQCNGTVVFNAETS